MKTPAQVISDHPFLQGLKAEHLRILIECAKEQAFGPGEILLREGEPANRFYLVEEGRIALEASIPNQSVVEMVEIQSLGQGEVLGWSWLFPPFAWHFQARAVEAGKVIAIDAGHLLAACERNHDFGFELMKRVSQILMNRLQASRLRLAKIQREHHAKPAKELL